MSRKTEESQLLIPSGSSASLSIAGFHIQLHV